ncbi:MAG TPA: FtsQ-type POTRA domain-containing protein [Polyangiaceae bacterium]|nr:FtsQ-type POTRA domain-containing protein [Polyangiaceae bacterium]
MTRGQKKRPPRASVVEAPSEYGFVASDSPPPGPVAPKAQATEPAGKSLWAVLWAGVRLSLGIVAVVSLSFAIAWGAHRYAVTSPRFSVREFKVTGNRHHGGAELAKIAGLEKGQNLFSIDTTGAELRLLENPWVSQAKVGRELPGIIRIDVTEREAAGVTTLDGVLYLVTAEGEPFKPVEGKDPTDLPVITGITPRDLAIDRARAVDRYAQALEVLREYAALPLGRLYEAEELHLEPDGSVVLTVGKKGTTLHLGKGPFRQKLLMAARVLAKVQAGAEPPGIVFLDNEAHPERVVVRMR